ncbi:MAG: hypothetical protein AAF628_29675 [Planctomycetota bacterium]
MIGVDFVEGVPPSIENGHVRLRVPFNMLQSWFDEGAQAFGMHYLPNECGFDVVQDQAWFGPIKMLPGELGVMELIVQSDARGWPHTTTRLRLEQIDEDTQQPIGGQDFVVPIGAPLDAAYFAGYGAGCPDWRGETARLQGVTPGSIAGGRLEAMTTNATPDALMVVLLGTKPTQLPLLGCHLFTVPVGFVVAKTDDEGAALHELPLPPSSGLVGLSLYLQSAILDGGRYGFAFTGGLEAGLGR